MNLDALVVVDFREDMDRGDPMTTAPSIFVVYHNFTAPGSTPSALHLLVCGPSAGDAALLSCASPLMIPRAHSANYIPYPQHSQQDVSLVQIPGEPPVVFFTGPEGGFSVLSFECHSSLCASVRRPALRTAFIRVYFVCLFSVWFSFVSLPLPPPR